MFFIHLIFFDANLRLTGIGDAPSSRPHSSLYALSRLLRFSLITLSRYVMRLPHNHEERRPLWHHPLAVLVIAQLPLVIPVLT